MMKLRCSRREFLGIAGMAAGAAIAQPALASIIPAPSSRVAIGICPEYDRRVSDILSAMFDQLGGLEKLVRGKTVAIKLNMTGPASDKLNEMPNQLTHWVHPRVIGSLVSLLGNAGAQRIRLLESAPIGTKPLEEFMLSAGWQPKDFSSAAARVEFENTNFLGNGKTYARFMVPGGGLMYAGYDLNHSYRDTDVFVSLAKLKEHRTAGITLSMKNCFGITPCTIYSRQAPEDEPSLIPMGYREPMHSGSRVPPRSAPQPVAESSDPGFRVPRVTADLVAARPIHLAVIDGIFTMTGGELPNQERNWIHRPVHPGVLIAGMNCVSTDAVATAVMGLNPMADRGAPPFETCDSTLRLAEHLGVGTRDLSRIKVVGTPIAKARFRFPTLTQLTT
ncbi:conserved exported hypothetical protein [Candidatus Sulfotelmatomonas gaucii]|uniref:DUF362 domain-containing protein n=1 Tax=Candidatus Sulfuritelmatomonas gaucii TaxID=2043161 RepID=A0A2N9L758_9BACT|nr:conserved exported hypothetical protein [Candidatus Sulfotelmatomonas gaucii]